MTFPKWLLYDLIFNNVLFIIYYFMIFCSFNDATKNTSRSNKALCHFIIFIIMLGFCIVLFCCAVLFSITLHTRLIWFLQKVVIATLDAYHGCRWAISTTPMIIGTFFLQEAYSLGLLQYSSQTPI